MLAHIKINTYWCCEIMRKFPMKTTMNPFERNHIALLVYSSWYEHFQLMFWLLWCGLSFIYLYQLFPSQLYISHHQLIIFTRIFYHDVTAHILQAIKCEPNAQLRVFLLLKYQIKLNMLIFLSFFPSLTCALFFALAFQWKWPSHVYLICVRVL